ncbi:hypothetical protein D0B54_02775 [Solimonas sp. K1W22B-7]|uniref:hypothetical protein n=1 Tax=Solimonas sp. K1W22B-7 TaxID=2303331 RepID=UPI000E335CAD|nr:hypothetical protein [Solimonas sp. K1W22B-7]AXQ27656.1 hypothetical protein D0B54_02775 [Solimonas sp. K1W22B-7]
MKLQRLITRGGLAATAMLASIAAAAAAEPYVAGTKTDPLVRSAMFLDADGRYFSALVELLSGSRGKDPARMPADFQWRLAESYLSFGMRDEAEAIYRNLATGSPDPLVLGRARLKLAEFDYQRGYTAEARATLLRMREKLPKTLTEDWQDLYTRVLMADGRYSEAAAALTAEDNASKLSEYTRYNLGIALINDGRAAQGITILDKVGRMRANTEEDLALRDRANLTLGYWFLQNKQGGTAKPVFSRVRLEGAFSNRALLGLGWAELAPTGEKTRRVEVGDQTKEENPFSNFSTLGVLLRPGFLEDDIFTRANLRSFRLSKARKDEEEALRKALVPWVELISRDPMDPAVQEAWLAIPFTLDRLGAHTQALKYYELAIEQLEKGRSRMNVAMESIRKGRMVETIVRRDIDSEAGWEWKLKDLPDAPETYFLQSLLAEHRFQEALKNYRDMRMLSRNIDAWRGRIDGVDKSWSSTEREPAIIPELLSRAKQDSEVPFAGMKIQLRSEQKLSAPGAYSGKLTAPAPVATPLMVSAAPAGGFNGPYERAQGLKKRMDSLRGLANQIGDDQDALLKAIAVRELAGQQRQIEKYLIEARFALARLYDRAQKGELDK